MNMELRNCPDCGSLFNFQGRMLCPKCVKRDEEDFLVVRKYIRDHQGATVLEVAEATNIEEEKILRFLREGRLESKSWGEVLECERCGRKISGGRYCSVCSQEVNAQVQQAIPKRSTPEPDFRKTTPRSGEKMFVKDRQRN